MLTKKWAVIEIAHVLGRNREAVVELEGKQVGFWLDSDDHPAMKPGTEVLVEFDPQDQFARIVV